MIKIIELHKTKSKSKRFIDISIKKEMSTEKKYKIKGDSKQQIKRFSLLLVLRL
jgi:hypothetical protein